jgi:phosphomannomutase
MANLRESLKSEPVELGFGTSGLRALVSAMTDLECYINAAGFLKYLADAGQIKPRDTVYLAGDLRDSTPRIMRAVAQAVCDGGYRLEYDGFVPTPALAFRSFGRGAGIMVTGRHIPADRNGIKFNKPAGEVLKPDEAGIKAAVAQVRAELYARDFAGAAFDADGMLKNPPELPAETKVASETYLKRYTDVFCDRPLAGKTIVFYQHSAVGRDLLVTLFEDMGAKVVPVGRSEVFVPIDSENVTADDRAYFGKLATEHPGLFAIVSTDGDSDRPFVVDEHGVFHRGDEPSRLQRIAVRAGSAVSP